MSEPGPDVELSLVLPCYNEAAGLRPTVIELLDALAAGGVAAELVLVDNGSTDGTGGVIDQLVAEGNPVLKVAVPVNQGYGHGILEGLKPCRGRLVGFMCADGQVEPADVVRIYDIAARATTPKLVKVRRRFRMDGMRRKLVSTSYNVLTTAMFGNLRSIDINGNPKILPRSDLEAMQLESKGWFLDAEVMIKAKRLGLEVYELNVLAKMREEGLSNVRPETCWEFAVNLLRYRLGRDGQSAGAPRPVSGRTPPR